MNRAFKSRLVMVIKINSPGFNLYPHSIVKEKFSNTTLFSSLFSLFPPPIPICISVLQVRELKIHWKDQTLGSLGLNMSVVPSPSLHTTFPLDASTKIPLNPHETSGRGSPASVSSLALPWQRETSKRCEGIQAVCTSNSINWEKLE